MVKVVKEKWMWMKEYPSNDSIIALYKDMTSDKSKPETEKIKAILEHVSNIDSDVEIKELFVSHYKDRAGKFEAFFKAINEIMEEENAMIPDERRHGTTLHRAPTFVSIAHLLRKGIERLKTLYTMANIPAIPCLE